MISMLRHIARRRRILKQNIDVVGHFKEWEESCVPSYCHDNFLAAYVSWQRLFSIAKLSRKHVRNPRRVLDFGSSVGELSHILKYSGDYDFIEIDDGPAQILLQQNSRARRKQLEDIPSGSYDAVFAIDSLEHNDDYAALLEKLAGLLNGDGLLFLSGPTENFLYRLGRKIAGYDGEYHHTTIFEIEKAASTYLKRVDQTTVPFGLPLFRISVWAPKDGTGQSA